MDMMSPLRLFSSHRRYRRHRHRHLHHRLHHHPSASVSISTIIAITPPMTYASESTNISFFDIAQIHLTND